jgi:hypothetical protein
MWFFDLIGFLVAGGLKIMFFVVLLIGIPVLFIVGISAILQNGFEWLEEYFTTPRSISDQPSPQAPPAAPEERRTEQQTLKPSEIVRQRAQRAVDLFIPAQPWLSLFYETIDDLIRGEEAKGALHKDKIRSETVDQHANTIVDALILLAKEIRTSFSSPLSTHFISCLRDPAQTVPKMVDIIFFNRCGDWTEKGHPNYGDLRPRALQAPYEVILSRVASYDKNGNQQYHRDQVDPEKTLDDTPFARILHQPVSLRYAYEERFSHMHIIGGNKAGKTTLLKRLVLHDILSDDPPALVIVDSHNDLVDYVSRLDLPHIRDKLVLITPRDRTPPAINIFAFNPSRLRRYSDLEKEQAATAAIETLDYLFEGMGLDLTGKQGILFEYCARLLLMLPEATGDNAVLQDLIDLMAEQPPAWFEQAVTLASDAQRDFFRRDYRSREFKETKDQLRYRLQGVRQTPTLDRLFSSRENVIDFYELLNDGAIILIDTAQDFLKQDSALYGRVFIARILQAIFERASIPEERRKPAFLFVDEANQYFDTRTKDILTDARKFKMGCVLAHHDLEECSQSLRAALATEPAIHMASRVSVDDAKTLATWMRTDPQFVLNQPRHHFATYIQDVTPKAVSCSVMIDEVDKQPRLSEAAYEEMRRRNRERVGARQQHTHRQRPPRPGPTAKKPPPETRPWTQQDDLALADAYAQLALAIRRGNAKRAAELQDHIDDFLDRKDAAEDDAWRIC